MKAWRMPIAAGSAIMNLSRSSRSCGMGEFAGKIEQGLRALLEIDRDREGRTNGRRFGNDALHGGQRSTAGVLLL
jgi:hypothetical protein